MRAWGITDVGLVRAENQDAYHFQVKDGQTFCLVCDGMGGARAGNVASALAAETFARAVTQPADGPEARLESALAAANEAVYHKAQQEPECRGMGTTLVAAWVEGDAAYLINVGDSRCYHVSDAGITQVTRDHSLVSDLVARGEITQEQARQHPNKNLITRALGVERRVKGDSFRVELTPGSVLLLCSDGLSNQVTNQEILYEIVHGGPHETCCGRLMDIAKTRGAPDNVTAVLLEFGETAE